LSASRGTEAFTAGDTDTSCSRFLCESFGGRPLLRADAAVAIAAIITYVKVIRGFINHS
jgi:hypothetical protein